MEGLYQVELKVSVNNSDAFKVGTMQVYYMAFNACLYDL